MAYSSVNDITLRFPEAVLAQVSQDDAGDSDINKERALIAISDADAEIDFYLAGKYAVPFVIVPYIIKMLSIHLAVHNLYKAKYDDRMPEEIARYRTESIETLEKIKSGLMLLPDGALDQNGDGDGVVELEGSVFAIETNMSEDDIIYSKDLLSRI